jgi:hypothetical protein
LSKFNIGSSYIMHCFNSFNYFIDKFVWHANRLKPYKDPRDFRPPPNDTANESIEDTEDSDNDDTNENTIKSQVDQAKQTKTRMQNSVSYFEVR